MCTDVPNSVEETAVFLIDTTKLKHINDIYCDFNAVWKPNGVPK
jgi:hypothetical protein